MQLRVDNVLVGCGIHWRAALSHDVVVVETTNDMDNGVTLANVAKELVAQALALGSALHQPGDVHYLARRRHYAARVHNLRQFGESLIGHGDDTEVRLYRTEREIGCLCLSARQAVEKRGLAHIRQSHDTTF